MVVPGQDVLHRGGFDDGEGTLQEEVELGLLRVEIELQVLGCELELIPNVDGVLGQPKQLLDAELDVLQVEV